MDRELSSASIKSALVSASKVRDGSADDLFGGGTEVHADLSRDLPANQTIAVAACVLLVGAFLVKVGKHWLVRKLNDGRDKTMTTTI